MPELPTSEAVNHGENTAITPENPNETPQPIATEREVTKQFPLRLPISVINDLENEVKKRRLSGAMIEVPMYCRFVLENHRKVSAYDAEIEAISDENAVLKRRILDLQLRDGSTADAQSAYAQEQPESAMETARTFKALQIAVQKAAETMSESGYFTQEYYETLVTEYFRQILPQIPK